MKRRLFIKNTSIAITGLAIAENTFGALNKKSTMKNKLPRWKGFNLLDYFSPVPGSNYDKDKTTEEDFRWMSDWGFDFVRLPMAYPRYINYDHSKKLNAEEVCRFDEKILSEIDQLIYLAHKYNLHVSLNLHRAPGYCINSGFEEPFDLWKDKNAQDAFYAHWDMWAKRYKNISSEKISFDLLNEPSVRMDLNDQHSEKGPVPGDLYRKIALNASKVIFETNPNHLIIADGNDVGNSVIPEIEDLKIGQSCRGYYPHHISHYKAPWAYKDPDQCPVPAWPGMSDNQYYGKEQLEAYYKPWVDLLNKGVGVHCGECGCWNKTPHDVFLSWFGDILDILTSNHIGYALWNFRGDFGIMDSGRTDVIYEKWYNHELDRKMLNLLISH